MASITSAPKAFVVRSNGTYNEETRKHPATAYIEKTQAFFDSGDHDLSKLSDLYTERMTIQSAHGERVESDGSKGFDMDHAFPTMAGKFYLGPYESYRHFHSQLIVLDADFGYDMYWFGDVYANIAGPTPEDVEKVMDPLGSLWEIAIPIAYHFELVLDDASPYGMRMRHINFIKDTGMVNRALEKREQGHLKTVQ